MTNFNRLEAFHAAVGQAVPIVPTVPNAATLELRQRLIEEEFKETLEAFSELRANPDVRGEAFSHLMRELADLLYVTYGTFVDCGVDADAVFAEVHRANMHKASGPRRADGKVLKPADWQPPDVAGVVRALLEVSQTNSSTV
jgi:predicted HAD superfamily Cof-like phosphohydrolase